MTSAASRPASSWPASTASLAGPSSPAEVTSWPAKTPACWPPMCARPSATASARHDDSWAAFEQLAGDDGPLDLAGAFPDAFHPQFAVEALGHVLAHVAAAAEHLHGPVGDPVGHFRGVQLGHGTLRVRDLDVGAGVDATGGLIGQRAGREQLGQAVGKHASDQAVLADRAAPGLPL